MVYFLVLCYSHVYYVFISFISVALYSLQQNNILYGFICHQWVSSLVSQCTHTDVPACSNVCGNSIQCSESLFCSVLLLQEWNTQTTTGSKTVLYLGQGMNPLVRFIKVYEKPNNELFLFAHVIFAKYTIEGALQCLFSKVGHRYLIVCFKSTIRMIKKYKKTYYSINTKSIDERLPPAEPLCPDS